MSKCGKFSFVRIYNKYLLGVYLGAFHIFSHFIQMYIFQIHSQQHKITNKIFTV